MPLCASLVWWDKRAKLSVNEISINKGNGGCRLACAPGCSTQQRCCGAPGPVPQDMLIPPTETLGFHSKNARREKCGGNYWQNCIIALVLLILNRTCIKDQALYVKDYIVLVKNISTLINKPAMNYSKMKSLP